MMRLVVAMAVMMAVFLGHGAAFAAIGVTVDDGHLRVRADASDVVGSTQIDDAPGFGMNGITRTATEGNAISKATYNWTNSGNQAVFEAVVSQELGVGGFETYGGQQFTFTITQTVNFLIEGQAIGHNGGLTGLHSYLFGVTGSTIDSVIFEEEDGAFGEDLGNSQSDFDLQIDGIAAFYSEGLFYGQLDPGTYLFGGQIILRDYDVSGGNAATGFTRLTLTDPNAVGEVPEPATLTIWGLGALGCAAAAYRRRNRAAI